MWYVLIPESMATIGSVCLGLAVVLALLDMPGGVNWSKIAAWFALIGGFGALGGAAGWLGSQILSGQQSVMGAGAHYGSQLIGGGILIVLLFAAGLWSYKHLLGKGIEAGGKGTWSKRLRALFKAGVFALVGATIATVIPPLYSGADWLVASAHALIV